MKDGTSFLLLPQTLSAATFLGRLVWDLIDLKTFTKNYHQMDLASTLAQVKHIDPSYSTHLNEVITLTETVKVNEDIARKAQQFRKTPTRRSAQESFLANLGLHDIGCLYDGVLLESKSQKAHKLNAGSGYVLGDFRVTLPVLGLESRIKRFKALKCLFEPLNQALVQKRGVYLGGVGSKFLFVRDLLTFCTREAVADRKSKRKPPLALANHIIEVHPFHFGFHPRSVAQSLQTAFGLVHGTTEIVTSTASSRMLEYVRICVEKSYRTVLLVVHGADNPSVCSLVPDIILPLHRQFPSKLMLLMSFDDLRFEAQLELWGVTSDPRAVVCPHIHTLLDHREEIKAGQFEVKVQADTRDKSCQPIINSSVNLLTGRLLMGMQNYMELPIDEESEEESEEEMDDEFGEFEKIKQLIMAIGGRGSATSSLKYTLRAGFAQSEDWTKRLTIAKACSKTEAEILKNFKTQLADLHVKSLTINITAPGTRLTLSAPRQLLELLNAYVSTD